MSRTKSKACAEPAVIDMTVRDDTSFLSPYSPSTRPVIDGAVADFLSSQVEAYHPKTRFTLRIHSNCIDGNEQEVYRRAISEHYTAELSAVRREVRHNARLALLFAIIGIFVLFLTVIVGRQLPDGIWAEVVDIVAWVFLWEATDLYFLEGRTLRCREWRTRALLAARTEFYPLLGQDKA